MVYLELNTEDSDTSFLHCLILRFSWQVRFLTLPYISEFQKYPFLEILLFRIQLILRFLFLEAFEVLFGSSCMILQARTTFFQLALCFDLLALHPKFLDLLLRNLYQSFLFVFVKVAFLSLKYTTATPKSKSVRHRICPTVRVTNPKYV